LEPHLISTKFERWVVVLKLFNYNRKRCLGRREKSYKCISKKLSLGITLTQKRENLKIPRIRKASINQEIKSTGNETSLVPELTELVIIQLV